MKIQFQYIKILLPVLIILTALNSFAQQRFVHTATKANNSCNYDCTTLDNPDLDNNPSAIIWVTPQLEKEVNLNPHPIGVYYFKNKWSIFNMDQKPIPEGSKFNVQYSAKPDATHFKYSIANENIRKDGSAYIDHAALENKPTIKFHLFPSWIPVDGGAANRYEIKTQFDPTAGKWFISNINEQYLYARVAYNIIIYNEENPLPGQGKEDPILSKLDSKTYKKPADTIPVISKIVPKTKIEDPAGVIISAIDKKDIVTKTPITPSYDFSNIYICIDKATHNSLPPKPPFTPYPVIPKIKSNGELEPVSTITQPLSGVTDLMWSPGDVIRVGFFPTNNSFATPARIKLYIKEYVKEWETYANVKFNFNYDVSESNIKIGFSEDNISWSWIGREVLVNPNNEKTMNFGSLNFYSQDDEFRRKILHEFGHALGFIHEHQSPNANIVWDTAKVYAFFGIQPANQVRAQSHDGRIIGDATMNKVDSSIFNKFSTTGNNSSAYDMQSIMHYFYPPELTKDGTRFYYNTHLSILDQTFAGQVYPFPPSPPTTTGVLKTGDDCDEIEFTIEYNVVHSSEVEFILNAGYDRNNNYALVNWWKMIGVPLLGGLPFTLELNNTIKLQTNRIDKRRPITFSKAKILGVHTGLAYTWDVLPAIVGGCRVKLVWRRDRCN